MNIKTGGSRPASRLTFVQANKSKQKWLPLRGACRRVDKEKANNPCAIPQRQLFLCAASFPKGGCLNYLVQFFFQQ
jgi:hypothetical protein